MDPRLKLPIHCWFFQLLSLVTHPVGCPAHLGLTFCLAFSVCPLFAFFLLFLVLIMSISYLYRSADRLKVNGFAENVTNTDVVKIVV